ncbi:MAG: branched-chain amino acid ABC transporter ATP-binding protein/permease [Pseudomonadota bacterium]
MRTLSSSAPAWRSPTVRWLLVVGALAALPLATRGEFVLFVASQIGIYFLVALGLNLLAGYGGQLSLGHGALMAIGAYATAIATVDHGLSFWLALPLAVAITAGAGALMALPSFRLSTWYFALVSLGFANVLGNVLIEWRSLTHGFQGIVGVMPPELFGSSFSAPQMYWLILAVAAGAFAVVRNLIESRFGRALQGLRENAVAVVGVGASPVRLKMTAFVISAVLAGVAGAFWAVQKTVVTPDDFVTDLSIFFLLVVVLGGLGRLYGPLIGTLFFFIVPELLTVLQNWRLMIYGVALLLLMLFAPGGLAGAFSRWRRRAVPPAATETVEDAPGMAAIQGASLQVEAVTKRFGGVAALTSASLSLQPGCVHALVGPNGSGKTTLLNLVSGYYPIDGGAIRIDGRLVGGMDAGRIARLGVRRTFQTPKLIPELSVLDNVLLGAYADEKASLAAIGLGLPAARREAAERRAEALRYLRFVGLDARANDEAGSVPHGQLRLVEIARALVGRPTLLLLDEPAAGLSLDELDGLGRLVQAIAALGTTVLIVEHHLELVANLCERVTVLAGGHVLAEGSPQAVFNDPRVMAAYMGARALDTPDTTAATVPQP